MIRSFYAPETARSTRPNIGKDGGNPVKRVLSALLVLMLVLALLPASALAETPYTRADAAVYLAETFGLADIHASRIEGYETTPKEMAIPQAPTPLPRQTSSPPPRTASTCPPPRRSRPLSTRSSSPWPTIISASARMRPSPCVKWPRPLPRRSTVPI